MSIATMAQSRREFLILAGASTVGAALLPAMAHAADNSIRLTSAKLQTGEVMPLDHTQHGVDISPPLAWEQLPAGTKELALIFEGALADTPRPFVHWVVYNIPADLKGLSEAQPMDAKNAAQPFVQGLTGWQEPGYRGPYPRAERQEFRFRLYALDKQLNLPQGLNSKALLKAIDGHVLDTGELVVVSLQGGRGSRK